ncbi:MAG: ABC transporter ATP-binding protein [candidate division Zixibacteria bacterium]|nr:ABC transporter ATP-binding protein [candidate division Zixibacteria bacterium]
MTVIDAQELSKAYTDGFKKRSILALDAVTFSVTQGEIFGLLGPNGAGKTTFMKVALGIVQATSGRINITGRRPSDPRSRRKVGYLPENHRFPIHLTGLGLLQFTGRQYGLSASEISDRTDLLLPMVGMDKWGETKIRKYSKGMQQRIGLAQALMPDPDVLMLDEPTDGVDPVGKVEIRTVLERIRGEGKSIVLNSHLLAEVESVADRVAILSRGHIVRIASIDDLTQRQCQFKIRAEIGNRLVEVPEEVGRILSLSSGGLVVELVDDDKINFVIDELRMKKIAIRSVEPLKVSLEQSFIEAITQPVADDGDGEKAES